MALKFTLKKKDYDKDERTMNAEEFMQRIVSMKRDVEKLKDIPNTELPKE